MTPLWLPRAAARLPAPAISEPAPEADADPLFVAFMGAVYQARKRADGTISRDAALQLWARCGGRCEVSGIPFSLEREGRRFARRPWAPSIDQIEAGKGYGLDNLRVVCIAVNYAMNHWGEAVLHRIAHAITASGKNRPQV